VARVGGRVDDRLLARRPVPQGGPRRGVRRGAGDCVVLSTTIASRDHAEFDHPTVADY